jgi:hypothetical protein
MNIDLQYPTSWEQVTREQILKIGKVFKKTGTREELLFSLFCSLTEIQPILKHGLDEDTPAAVYFFRKGKVKFSLEIKIITTACEQLSFLIDKIGFPECPVQGFNKKLYGTSFRKYYFADAYFMQYQNTSDTRYLKLFFKTLFGQKFKRDLLIPISIWWAGLKSYMLEQYPDALQSDEGYSERSPADMLQDLLSVLNKNSPERNESILDADCHSVLIALNNIYSIAKQHDKHRLS